MGRPDFGRRKPGRLKAIFATTLLAAGSLGASSYAAAQNTAPVTRETVAVTAPPGVSVTAPQTPHIPQKAALTDDQLLDLAQKQTLNYFIDFAHPVSGMARERTNNVESYGGDIVATGGTGFGVMAMIAGASRGFITRDEALERTTKIVDFLSTKADTYHGVFPHYMDGATGKTFNWNPADNGGDVVETSYLMQGLLTARQYFSGNGPAETALRGKINKLWENVDWTWHTRGSDQGLTWNWSPDQDWKIDLPIHGWNECLITYVLAASSPTHPISRVVYEHGWGQDGLIKNGKEYEGIKLPLGQPEGGPLFFTQYSFLGLDPRGLKDQYADYGEQTRNQAVINHAYALRNPLGFKGYGAGAWGLTASDGTHGYSDFSPTNDQGVIAPTAALSSFPYTPEFSMQALRHFYEDYDGKLWGKYGFVDSFDETHNWQANTNLAIDQGPIVVMIENYRSGLLWNLFMSAPEVQRGLKGLGFESPRFQDSIQPSDTLPVPVPVPVPAPAPPSPSFRKPAF